MIQIQQRHPPGTFRVCKSCGNEPRHIIDRGRKSNDPILFGIAGSTERHHLDCHRCRHFSVRGFNLAEAIADWGSKYARHDLPVPFQQKRRSA